MIRRSIRWIVPLVILVLIVAFVLTPLATHAASAAVWGGK